MEEERRKRKRKAKKSFGIASVFFMLFILWTLAIQYIDVQAIGPGHSVVGFAAFNGFFHNVTGVHMLLYTITDWLGLVPIFIAFSFVVLGFVQLVKRRSLFKVDCDILIFGGVLLAVV